MTNKPKQDEEEKTTMHPRNAHRNRYDFQALVKTLPELGAFVSLNQFNDLSIDFKNPEAVKMLNKALLKHFYGIAHWDIPEGFLCPPIPGRADYIHYMADVLAGCNEGVIPTGKSVKVLDIGVGANCIYPIIGNKAYGWSFVGAEVDHIAVRSAKNIVEANNLPKVIEIRKQSSSADIFNGIIKPGELFDLTMCNPPFHASLKEAAEGTERKWKNLGTNENTQLNFGGQNTELWCEGGEERFLNKMISESAQFKTSCFWFSSLISKKTTLPACYKNLEYFGARDVKTIPMAQGQKTSRILAWTYLDKLQQEEWQLKRWKK
ncbi:MAG: rRNA methyltransferase [Mucilaginibacter sp.]|nr:rRNA methyltransferase [Mucilaginibacter sp.]